MSPWRRPKASSSTLTIGTRQFVVQEAAETTKCCAGVEGVVVDPDDEGGVGLLARRRDDHPLRARLEVASCGLAGRETPGGLDHDVDVQARPSAIAFGSLSSKTVISRSPTLKPLSVWATSTSRRPKVES